MRARRWGAFVSVAPPAGGAAAHPNTLADNRAHTYADFVPPINKTRTRTAAPDNSLTRLRIALTVFFALDGFVFAGWVVRIPAIKEQTGASASALGLALLGVSAGAVITMMLTGRLCRRYGTHRVTVVCAVLLSLSVALPPLTHSAPALGAVLLVFGAAYGSINVAFNSAAVDLVGALRQPIMPSFHAAFSLGGMLGAGLGGLVAGALSPTRHLLGLTVIGLLVTAVAGRTLLRIQPPAPAPDTTEQEAAPHPSGSPAPASSRDRDRTHTRTRGLVITFGLIALCTAYGEGPWPTGVPCTWSTTWTPRPASRRSVTRVSRSP